MSKQMCVNEACCINSGIFIHTSSNYFYIFFLFACSDVYKGGYWALCHQGPLIRPWKQSLPFTRRSVWRVISFSHRWYLLAYFWCCEEVSGGSSSSVYFRWDIFFRGGLGGLLRVWQMQILGRGHGWSWYGVPLPRGRGHEWEHHRGPG